MSNFTNPLNNIKIASPCSANWDEMIGDERKRFCGDCKLNVYNLSGMTKQEAENLIIGSEGRLCVRFYRRADGSVLTKDCPVGWAAIKRRVSRVSAALASLLFGMLAGLGMNSYFSKEQPDERIMGAVAVSNSKTAVMGDVATPMMGNVAPAYNEPEDLEITMGKPAIVGAPEPFNNKEKIGKLKKEILKKQDR